MVLGVEQLINIKNSPTIIASEKKNYYIVYKICD